MAGEQDVDSVAVDEDAEAAEVARHLARLTGVFQLPELGVPVGLDGLHTAGPPAFRASPFLGVLDGERLFCALWACADDGEVFAGREGLFVAPDDSLQCLVIVCCCGHGEDGVFVGDDAFPRFVPWQVRVGCVDFADLFVEPCFGFCDEVLCVGVDWQWRVAPAGRVSQVADACLLEHDAAQGR